MGTSRARNAVISATLLLSFSGGAADVTAEPKPAEPKLASRTSSQPEADVIFTGMCDASGAVALDDRLFAVANDEDNIVRVYDAERGGPPLHAYDLSPVLPLRNPASKAGKAKPPKPGKAPEEADIEAATKLKDVSYWLTSHGRNSKGKKKAARFMVFATTTPRQGQTLALVGQPYVSLLQDFAASPALRELGLARAAQLPPKQAGGLNMEGLTAMADGSGMFIGFRNPVPKGRALLVPWSNPREVMDGERANLGAPILLDLGGRGVRALSWWRGQYLIVAGHHSEGGGTAQLYSWSGQGAPRVISAADLTGFNPEGFFTPEGRTQIMLMSDDGSVPRSGAACKDLPDPTHRRFRGRWLQVPPATGAGAGNPPGSRH